MAKCHGLYALILVRTLQLAGQMVLLIVVRITAYPCTCQPHRAVFLDGGARAIYSWPIATRNSRGARAEHLCCKEGALRVIVGAELTITL